MTKMLQVRNVPDDVHGALKARAARAGMSLSEFVLRELTDIAESPTLDEVLDDAAANATGSFTFEELNEIIRRDRESH